MYHIDFNRLRQEHDELMRKHDWLDNIPWWRRLLMRLLRSESVFYFGDDTHVFIRCECGEELSANESWVEWCSRCGRGYRTEMHIYKYPGWVSRALGGRYGK